MWWYIYEGGKGYFCDQWSALFISHEMWNGYFFPCESWFPYSCEMWFSKMLCYFPLRVKCQYIFLWIEKGPIFFVKCDPYLPFTIFIYFNKGLMPINLSFMSISILMSNKYLHSLLKVSGFSESVINKIVRFLMSDCFFFIFCKSD